MLTLLFSICQLSTCNVSTSVLQPNHYSPPFSLNSRYTLRRAHTSSIYFHSALSPLTNLNLKQNNADIEAYVSSIILHATVDKDAYASKFY